MQPKVSAQCSAENLVMVLACPIHAYGGGGLLSCHSREAHGRQHTEHRAMSIYIYIYIYLAQGMTAALARLGAPLRRLYVCSLQCFCFLLFLWFNQFWGVSLTDPLTPA